MLNMHSKIVTSARGWIGTRFRHQGRIKKSSISNGGCDCIGLVVGVLDEVGILINGRNPRCFDSAGYAKTPDGHVLKNSFDNYMQSIPIEDAVPGDILMFRFDQDPQHVAFVSDIGLIHCYLQAKGVVEHGMDSWWRQRIVGGIGLWEFRVLINSVSNKNIAFLEG